MFTELEAASELCIHQGMADGARFEEMARHLVTDVQPHFDAVIFFWFAMGFLWPRRRPLQEVPRQ